MANVHLHPLNVHFMFIGLYGKLRVDKHKQFWSYFAYVYSRISISWIVLGDYKGHNFTWRRGKLMERFDQDFGNKNWFQTSPNSYLYHLPFNPTSNHRPIMLILDGQNTTPKIKLGWRIE